MKRREFAGLSVVVENEAGSTRQWFDRDAKVSGETKMLHDYGFIEGHVGTDGDEVDCYLGPNEQASFCYVVHQRKAPEFASHDEDKVMLGFDSEADAKAAYLAHRNDDDKAYGGMTAIPMDDFKRKLERRTGTGKIRHEVSMATGLKVGDYVNSSLTGPAQVDAVEPNGDYHVRFLALGGGFFGSGSVSASVVYKISESEALRIMAEKKKKADARGDQYTINFDIVRGNDGKLRVGVWDRFTTWGDKVKSGQATRFDEETLGQMVANWLKRGDALAMDFNHQSSYTAENGQPAPALAWYDALVIVRGGQIIGFEKLDSSNAAQPPNAVEMDDGLWGYRSEVTELGEQLLPNFKYISPTFTPEGTDELGNTIGYVLHAVAATNTPFQAGTAITFEKDTRKEMANFEQETMAKLGLEAGADDEAVKAAYTRKMEAAHKMLDDDCSPEDMKKMAEEMEELAGLYAAAYQESEGPHVSMRRMAARLSQLATAPDADDATMDDDTKEPAKMEDDKKEEKMEAQLRQQYSSLANRLGVKLPEGATSQQMFDAISAATVPAAQLPVLVDARVKQVMMEQEQKRAKEETARKASILVDMAITGGYPKEQRDALLHFASDPKTFAAAEAMVKPFLKNGVEPQLFQQFTASGAPLGVDPRKENAGTGKDRKIVRNELATFVVEGERFSNTAKEWADAKDGPIKMEIDAQLSDSEQGHAGYRLIIANKLLRQKRPDLWAAAEEQDL